MSHSHFFSSKDHHYTIICNGDYSGPATIIKKPNNGEEHPSFRSASNTITDDFEEIEVDCDVLRDFVLGMVRSEMIRKIENIPNDQLFDVITNLK